MKGIIFSTIFVGFILAGLFGHNYVMLFNSTTRYILAGLSFFFLSGMLLWVDWH